jgi:hypothetical protein
MNTSKENQDYVRKLLFQKQQSLSLAIACVIVENDLDIIHTVGFGECETEVPARFGADEIQS